MRHPAAKTAHLAPPPRPRGRLAPALAATPRPRKAPGSAQRPGPRQRRGERLTFGGASANERPSDRPLLKGNTSRAAPYSDPLCCLSQLGAVPFIRNMTPHIHGLARRNPVHLFILISFLLPPPGSKQPVHTPPVRRDSFDGDPTVGPPPAVAVRRRPSPEFCTGRKPKSAGAGEKSLLINSLR